MIILPTHKRRANLERFIEACRETHVTEPILLMIDDNDHSYDGLILPINFIKSKIIPGTTSSERLNLAFGRFPNKDYYAVLGDDVEPLTYEWDRILADACLPASIAYGNDGIQGEKLCTIPFIGGDFARAWGKLAEPTTKHWFSDNIWQELGRALGKLKYMPDVEFKHHHWSNGTAPMDETYAKQPPPLSDAHAFDAYMKYTLSNDVRKIQNGL